MDANYSVNLIRDQSKQNNDLVFKEVENKYIK
jgi:hypothetical protein